MWLLTIHRSNNNIKHLNYDFPNWISFDSNIFYHLFMIRNAPDGESEKTEFLNIYVHDNELIKITKNNLQKRDRVFIRGFLSHKPDTDQKGQKTFSGNIEATNILKVDRFSEANNENLIEDQV